jgi:hypothetical protein
MFGMVQHPASPAEARIASLPEYQVYPQHDFGSFTMPNWQQRS